jgi:hypothetical protein
LDYCGHLLIDLLHESSDESGNLALTRSFPAVDDIDADTEQ